jgi:cell division protein FtsW
VSTALGQRGAGEVPDEADVTAGARAGLAPGDAVRGLRDGAGRFLALLDRPLASYYLVLGCTLLLLAVGLMMVLSTSTAYDIDYRLPVYSMFQKQVLGAAGGLVIMFCAARMKPRVFRACAYPLLGLSILGLVLVLVAGQQVDGAERWLQFGGLQIQPSEFAKLAFAVWGADLLARKDKFGQLTDWRQLLIPLLPCIALIAMLVMLGDDLGTTFLLLVIFLALLWLVGSPARLLVGMVGLLAFVMIMLVVVHPYELERLTGFLSAQSAGCRTASCYQLTQGKNALGSGGLFGLGSGASRAKWGWVPQSTTDFIFAILGEELGLAGTLCVVLLYGVLAYAGLRIARRVPDAFSRLAAGAITVWITVQALVNIGAVLGVLPITGVPLPLISAGVSSLLVTLTAAGMLMAFARCEPGAQRAQAVAGRPRLVRWLGFDRRPPA